jgi:choline dehydrogenase-like flavoprotein
LAREIWDGYARAEQRIGVTSMGELHSRSALKVREGAKKLGWAYHDVHRNTPGCRGTSRCLSGCVSDAKQSMLLTYLKDAEAHGAVCYADTQVTRLEGDFGTVKRVRGVRGSKPFVMEAERVFVAAGAVFTPFLLLKSGIKHLRAIGRHLTIHPSTRAYYVFDEPVNASLGAFQSFAVHEFRNEGIHLISLFPPPGAFAASLPAIGPELRTLLHQLPNIGIMGGLISDASEGRVLAAPLFQYPIVRYTMQPHDKQKLLRAIRLLGELGFAAGAKELYLPFNWRPPVKNHHELDKQLAEKIVATDFEITAQHPLGTCRMGYDEDLSVVREDGRVHGYDNLYVVDSSVIPTSIGVNPMLTVLAVAEVIGASLV